MSEPTNNSPLGTPNNRPNVDSGTMARSLQKPPGSTGRAFSLARKSVAVDVLAQFDLQNGVIWANQALVQELKQTHNKGGHLRSKDIETLAHEFAHVHQYDDIFEKHSGSKQRVAEMIKRRTERVMSSTEDEYVAYVLKLEARAEYKARIISMELLNAFQTSRGRDEYSLVESRQFAKLQTLDWVKASRKSYEADARKNYRKIRDAAKKHGGAEGVAKDVARKETQKYRMIQVSKIKSSLPTKRSATLRKLVAEMIKFDIVIVVGSK